jgi:recombination protein U
MIKYPGGKIFQPKNNKRRINSSSAANRGMELEKIINESNVFYNENDIALITKRPTPINVIKVDYSSNARIVDAYFEKQSTTDYNGIYRGRYIDFEAKSCRNRTSFPLSNIFTHQINHLQKVIKQGGIAFFIIWLVLIDETYLVPADRLLEFQSNKTRKSITINELKKMGILIDEGLNPRLDYLKAVDRLFFNR